MRSRWCVLSAIALTASGCGDDAPEGSIDADMTAPDTLPNDATIDSPAAAMQTATIGPSGGSINVDGATLVIPAGALAADATVTVEKTPETATFGSNTSPIYRLSPDGLKFATPITFTLHMPAPPSSSYLIAWSKLGVANPTTSTDYEYRPVVISGNDVAAMNTHFSKVFGGLFLGGA